MSTRRQKRRRNKPHAKKKHDQGMTPAQMEVLIGRIADLLKSRHYQEAFLLLQTLLAALAQHGQTLPAAEANILDLSKHASDPLQGNLEDRP